MQQQKTWECFVFLILYHCWDECLYYYYCYKRKKRCLLLVKASLIPAARVSDDESSQQVQLMTWSNVEDTFIFYSETVVHVFQVSGLTFDQSASRAEAPPSPGGGATNVTWRRPGAQGCDQSWHDEELRTKSKFWEDEMKHVDGAGPL